ncbi:MAG TPA: N-acetyltransferase [Thermomicrobiales bacterium]|nr:N-acetyltransferase [Thermomicrobiales bacterium]
MTISTGFTTQVNDAALAIEPARWRDLRTVAGLQRDSFRRGLAYGLGALIALRTMPGVTFLVARAGDAGVVGCVIADRFQGDARVVNLAVAPSMRRKGIGTQLLRAIDAACPGGDIVLMAEAENAGAQLLYEREGYVRSGTARDYYGRGQHGIRMRKVRMPGPRRTIVV